MWLKNVDGGYYNMLTGTTVDVKQAAAGDYRIHAMVGSTPIVCLQKGYRTEDDARDALESTLDNEHDVVSFDVPEYSDDEDDNSESEEDDGEVTDDYDTMSNDELRAAITERNELDAQDPDFQGEPMSTQGNKKALISRLRADDKNRVQEEV